MTWKGLHHQNVLPLLGVTMSGDQFAMVSEWMANGNINEFVETDRDANRFKLVGLCFLCRSYPPLIKLLPIAWRRRSRVDIYTRSGDGTQGLERGMVSDTSHHTFSNVPCIKANILIDKDGNARLADFGLLTIVSDPTHPETTTTSGGAGTVRWMSPELLDPEEFGFKNARPTKQSDCYALGMVILEVLTGRAPFPCCNTLVVMRKIIRGERPGRPQGQEAVWFTDDLWGMLEQCWLHTPKLRPTVEDVLECLEQGLETWKPLPRLSADSDPQVDSDEDSDSTISHHPRGSFHLVFFVSRLTCTTAPVVSEVVQRDGKEPRVLSQCHPYGVGANQGSSHVGCNFDF